MNSLYSAFFVRMYSGDRKQQDLPEGVSQLFGMTLWTVVRYPVIHNALP